MPRPRFSPEVNFGHILQAVVLALTIGGGGVTSYISLRGDIEQLRADLGVQIASHELRIEASERALEQRRLDDRDFQAEMRAALAHYRRYRRFAHPDRAKAGQEVGLLPAARTSCSLIEDPMLLRKLTVADPESDGVRYKFMRPGTPQEFIVGPCGFGIVPTSR
jgi:hypothetical protein